MRKLTVAVDMNGIVHPCTHPEGRPAPETEEEMMVEIFKYTERVVNMTRPRKVLMMAIGQSRLPATDPPLWPELTKQTASRREQR